MGQTAPLVSVLCPPRHPTWAPPRSALRSHARYLRSGTRRLPPPETSRLGGRASKLPVLSRCCLFLLSAARRFQVPIGSYSAETQFCKAHATGAARWRGGVAARKPKVTARHCRELPARLTAAHALFRWPRPGPAHFPAGALRLRSHAHWLSVVGVATACSRLPAPALGGGGVHPCRRFIFAWKALKTESMLKRALDRQHLSRCSRVHFHFIF